MGARRIRREQRQADMKKSRHENGIRKAKERKRRDERMIALLKKSKPPYLPALASWLSCRLGKPSQKITEEDVKTLLV
ncbi:MAG: hypothetical protein KatS3mg105_1822 [Gemmatales bacterium]|nr:MAG: hypothetical protein KatS3mg105_1822 [Gemmatales bacterium]